MDSSSFDEIFRRFQSVTGTSTQQELADVLGIKQSTISESKKRGTVPPGWFLVLFEMRGVNPDWLKQGKGPIYLRTEDGRYMEPEPAATPRGRGVSLPYYDSDRVQDGVWEQFFTEKPEPLTREEKKAWIAQNAGVALGSDAFFPLGDNIERAHKSGVQYIAEAGGSIRDDNVIETCDKYGIAMEFTHVRLFHH